MCFTPQRACTFSTSQLPKVVRTWCALYILTSKCASRHNGVRFFNISASKSGPDLVCFVHFDFEMCFAPQRRALFHHRNFEKWSEPVSFLHFCLGKTHNGVQFFISHLASRLRTRRFSEPTFGPSAATNHWKNTVFRDFPTFSRTWIFFLLRLSLSSSLLFSDSSQLCFSSVHIVGSLTSKLPSISYTPMISIHPGPDPTPPPCPLTPADLHLPGETRERLHLEMIKNLG